MNEVIQIQLKIQKIKTMQKYYFSQLPTGRTKVKSIAENYFTPIPVRHNYINIAKKNFNGIRDMQKKLSLKDFFMLLDQY
jgi:hypothetical protein